MLRFARSLLLVGLVGLLGLVGLVGLVGCGGRAHPAPKDTFDAKALAADLNALTSELANAATAPGLDCAATVQKLGEIEQRGRPLVEHAREAQLVPDHAKRLTKELRVYDNLATGRSEAIARRLAICFREHGELHDQIQHVVDAMPTL